MTERMRNAAKWALHAHYARLLGIDGFLLGEREKSAEMTSELVREIADEYLVTRSIPSVGETWGKQSGQGDWINHHRRLLATAINDVTWSDGLVERAEQCKALVEQLAEAMRPSVREDRTKKITFASGMTKLSWFDAPRPYWTLFDKYARRAVCGQAKSDALDTMVAFYGTLADRGFVTVVDAIGEAVSALGVDLYPGKIVDHYLMACAPVIGETEKSDFGASNEALGRVLDRRLIPCARDLLNQCAAQVATILLDSKLVPAQTSRRTRA